MPDVRLPSGQVIKNVPDGTSKEELMRKLIAKGLAREEDFQPIESLKATGDTTPEGRPVFQNQDGDFVTERSITINDPRINQGRATNIPTVFEGRFLNEQEAIDMVASSGGKDPITGRALQGFDSIDLAVNSAKERSANLLRTPSQQRVEAQGRVSPLTGLPAQPSPTIETAQALVRGAVAKPVAGLAGFGGLGVTKSQTLDNSADVVRSVEESISFTPTTPESIKQIETIGELPFIKELGQVLTFIEEDISKPLGILTAENVSPAAGAVVRAVTGAAPDILLTLLGIRSPAVVSQMSTKAAKSTFEATESAVKNVLNRPEIRVLDETGSFTDEALQALNDAEDAGKSLEAVNTKVAKQLEQGNILTAQEAERFNLFTKRGLQSTKAQVTQKGTDFIEQQELAKQTNEVSELLASQDVRLSELAREGVENIGPIANDIIETNESIFSVINNIVDAAENEVTKAYLAAREAAPTEKVVQLDTFITDLRKSKGGDDFASGVSKAVESHLKNVGILNKKGQIVKTGETGTAGLPTRATAKRTVAETESVRQFMNQLFGDTNNPRAKRVLTELKSSLDKDVETAVGSDFFKKARESKIELQRIIEKQSRDKRDKTKGSLLEDIIFNKVPQEKIVQKLKISRDDDFLKIKEFFTKESGDQGKQAWNNIKAQILNDAIDSAVSTAGKAEGGFAVFNANKFKAKLQPLRDTEKFKALFNAAEIELIDDIIAIGRLRTPTSKAVSGEGPSAISVTKAAILSKIPFIDKAQALHEAVKTRGKIKSQVQPALKTEKLLRQSL